MAHKDWTDHVYNYVQLASTGVRNYSTTVKIFDFVLVVTVTVAVL